MSKQCQHHHYPLSTTYNYDFTESNTHCSNCYTELIDPKQINELFNLHLEIKWSTNSLINNEKMIRDGQEAPFWSRRKTIKEHKEKLIKYAEQLKTLIEEMNFTK